LEICLKVENVNSGAEGLAACRFSIDEQRYLWMWHLFAYLTSLTTLYLLQIVTHGRAYLVNPEQHCIFGINWCFFVVHMRVFAAHISGN